eukprot:gb/GEZN01002970.1/.p1 GENE.gb/GEZN01002970.1/~~gb/GEZN01002970.1/.p1  ORF type:complete len:599 (-),score=104.34 gb/GEZN01002970.1/:516-2285(-)
MGDEEEDWGDTQFEGDDGWSDEEQRDGWDQDAEMKTTKGSTSAETKTLVSSKSKPLFEILEATRIGEQLDSLVTKCAEVLFISKTEAYCLLKAYGWKAKKLEEDWFLDMAKVRREKGLTLTVVDSADPIVGTKRKKPTAKTVQCLSAYCDRVPVEKAAALPCGHWFCNDCWSGFLESQVRDGSKSIHSTCMGMRCTENHPHKFGCSCKEMVPKEFFEAHLKDEALLAKFQSWLLDSFVEGQQHIKWCPNPKCTRAISFPSGGTQDFECKCQYRFCFSCLQEAHAPAPCDLVRKWLQKEQSDDATTIWLAARTKECPNCKVRIEKNRACNHMTCAKCNHHFCWLCKGPWKEHGNSTGGYYVCNLYMQDVGQGKRSDEEKTIITSQQLLQKYMHYYKYYKDHKLSIAMTQDLGIKIERKLQKVDINKYAFLLEAVEKLVESRRTLQWVYVMAYYMKNGLQKHLFEYQQQMLSGKTEELQDLLETSTRDGPGTDNNDLVTPDKRRKVQDLAALITKFRCEVQNMVEKGDFEESLLTEADTVMEDWACSMCSTRNRKTAEMCDQCLACRLHGEADCKGCKKKAEAAQSSRGTA